MNRYYYEHLKTDIEGHKAITVIIPTELFSKCIEEIDQLRFVVKPQDEALELKKIMLEIAQTQEQESVEYDYMHLMSLTWQLLFHLCQNYQEKQEKIEEGQGYNMKLICQIMDYINEHFCNDLSVQAIAEEFNFSREYISRVFKRYTGTTIMEQIIQTRMEYAHEQLVKTEKSIESIAIISGFGDARNFKAAMKGECTYSDPMNFNSLKLINIGVPVMDVQGKVIHY